MKTLSVIIPLYNAEKYICQAVNSILCQKGIEMEIIVINDGSTDHSLERLSVYGELVKILNISNSGASAARNVGLKYATGENVMFLDADDYIVDDSICSTVIAKMEETSAEMGMFLYTYYNNESCKYVHLKSFPHDLLEKTDCSELTYQLIYSGIAPVSPCCKIIKRRFLIDNNLFFVEGTVAEDIEWFVRLLICTKRICLINNDSYIYRKNISSSVTGSITKAKCANHYSMIYLSIQRLSECEDEKKKDALYSILSYQYCIWLSQIWFFIRDKEFVKMNESLCWLLRYDLFPKVKYVKWVYKIIGVNTAAVLYMFYKLFSKSNK